MLKKCIITLFLLLFSSLILFVANNLPSLKASVETQTGLFTTFLIVMIRYRPKSCSHLKMLFLSLARQYGDLNLDETKANLKVKL